MLYQVTKVMFVDGIIWSRQTINNLERIKIGAFFTQVNPSNAQNSHDCLPRPKPSTTRPIRDDQFLLCSTCVQCLRLQKGITATYFAKAGAALFHSGGSEVLNRNAWLSAGKSDLISDSARKIFRIICGLSGFSCEASRLVICLSSAVSSSHSEEKGVWGHLSQDILYID